MTVDLLSLPALGSPLRLLQRVGLPPNLKHLDRVVARALVRLVCFSTFVIVFRLVFHV